ncbi:MAG: tetratricopeptide repeat protein, partial [Pseudolabrys sp.]
MPTRPLSLDDHGHCEKKVTRAFAHSKFANLHMVSALRQSVSIIGSAVLILMLGLPAVESWAAAEPTKFQTKLKNIQLCNGSDRSSPEPQIKGCTGIIDSGNETALVLAIAYNNRGDAYAAKGDYDLAINDYDTAIKLNPDFAKPFNNRGVVFQKKGEYDRAIKDFDEAIK